MFISIGKTTQRLNEPTVREIQKELRENSPNLDKNIGVYPVKEWLDAICSYMCEVIKD